ncbi:MAG: family 43 glycosylhydrolase [Tenericutes bacterium]|nr:family 43 glycosylhydrolase [Mycoplasmatota bacterium]
MKKFMIIALMSLTVFLVSCDSTVTTEFVTAVEEDFIESRDTYDNVFDETQIPEQWEGYGVGDPYVLRHNGEYYLYCSTKNSQIGVRAWKSSDLVNWVQVNNGTNQLGYVSEDPITETAYAPEVIYWDGVFYMYTSPAGHGHYILTSDSPIGPFEVVSDNLGESIDGSVFIDNDESMYFLRAFNTGIRMVSMADPLTFESGTTLDNTLMGSWTEGPTLINRFGTYYLTYTGTNVTSSGYRVNYSTASVLDGRSSFEYADNNSLLLSTVDGFEGLGHSSTVLGPNLDSYYIVYHNLNSAAGPNRSFNINRLLFNGTMMNVNGAGLTENLVPELPDFQSVDGVVNYTQSGDYYLSNTSTESSFSAEFNFIGSDFEALFGYVDENNYFKVSLDTNEVVLSQMVDGTLEELTTGTLNSDFDFTKLHTLRVLSDGEKVSVLFDNLTKIDEYTAEVAVGKIAYKSSEMMYSSFSNYSYGSSDKIEAKKDMVGSNQFVDEASSDVTLNVIEPLTNYSTNNPDGSNEITIAKELGYASYYIDIEESGLKAIFMNLKADQSDKTIAIQIDNAEPILVTIPSLDSSYDYTNTLITEIYIPKGLHQIKFIALEDDFTFNYFNVEKSSYSTPSYEASLTEYLATGAEYQTLWKLNDGHYAIAGNRQIIYFGDDTIRDCTIEVTMKFIGETASASAGIILKGSNFSEHSSENNDSIVGYYIGFNNYRAFIDKYNYNVSDYGLAVSTDTRPVSGEEFTVKVVCEGNMITVFVDDVEIMEYYDNDLIMTGRIGFYSEGAEVVYSDLTISE